MTLDEATSICMAKLVINSGGALVTSIALGIILVAKFTERPTHQRIDLRNHAPPVALVPVKRWDCLSRKAVEYALGLTPDVTALHITTLDGPDAECEVTNLERTWREYAEDPARDSGLPAPRLLFIASPFRSVVAPFLKAIQHLEKHRPGQPVMIVLPELVEGRLWGYVMHAHRERRLRAQLLKYGGVDTGVTSVPWQLQPIGPAQGLAVDEPSASADRRPVPVGDGTGAAGDSII